MANPKFTWEKMYSLWNTLDVPEIGTLQFIFKKDNGNCPWYSNKNQKQEIYTSNPITDTAFHLNHLKDKNPELKAVYKIYAFLRAFHHEWDYITSIAYAFNKYDYNTYDWWQGNARILFPNVDFRTSKLDLYSRVTSKDWEKVVLAASDLWTLLAQEYSIKLIPAFMDKGSEEYKKILAETNRHHENLEYQEYLRLKKKYDEKK